jgi:hypothetical protein
MANFILPYEPQYVGHWQAEQRRKETERWLRRRESSRRSPSIVPDHPVQDDELPAKERAASHH